MITNILNKLRNYFYYQRINIYSFDIKRCTESFQEEYPVNIEFASLDEIKELNRSLEMDLGHYQWEYLKGKVEQQKWQCLVSRAEGKITGYGFFSTNEMSFAGTKIVQLMLPPRSSYMFKLFVHPNYRNQALGKQLTLAKMNILKEMGYDTAYYAVNSTNKIQIHNVKTLGGKYLGPVVFIKGRFINHVSIPRKITKASLKLEGIYDYS